MSNSRIPEWTPQPILDNKTLKAIPKVNKKLDGLVTIEEQNDNNLFPVLDELMFPFDDLDLTPSNKPISHEEEQEPEEPEPVVEPEQEEQEEEEKKEEKKEKKRINFKRKRTCKKKTRVKNTKCNC